MNTSLPATAQPPAVIVDVDTGIDDALALTYLTSSPLVRLLGVTCVAGNADVDQVLRNTLDVLTVAEAAEDLPVGRGAERPLINEPRTAHGFHGQNGLGGLRLPTSPRKPVDQSALELMCHLVQSSTTPVTLLGLGPATNIALFVRAYPALSAQLAGIVFMGGSVAVGNATPVAEFNAWHDPEALSIVVRSGVPVTMYGLEVFMKPTVDASTVAELIGSPVPAQALVGQLLAAYGKFEADAADIAFSGLGDAGAACLCADPSLGKVTRLPMEVELGGTSRGQTIVDQRGVPGEAELHGGQRRLHLIDVVTDLDAARTTELFLSTVRQAVAR